MSIFKKQKKEKPVDPVKAAKAQVKLQKKQAKQTKKAAKVAKAAKTVKPVSGKGIIISRLFIAPISALGAATYQAYLMHGVSLAVPSAAHPTLALAASTLGLSALAAAPVARSVKRLNAQNIVSADLNPTLSALSSSVEELRQKIAGGSSTSPQPSIDVSALNGKIDALSAKIDSLNSNSASAPTPQAASSTVKTSKNHIAK